MITLFPFQQEAVAEIERHIAEGRRKLLLVAPTGSGKTVIASELIRRSVAQYRRVLFLAHRREIIMQTSAKLVANGIRHGIVMANVDPRPMESVQVASIDTLHVRGVRSDAMNLPPADLVIFDEAHRARGRTREHLIGLYPQAALLGMTATPCRGDGRGLTGHDFLKSLGIALIPATAPDFFTEDTPTAVLVRQVLGAIAQFEKTSLVAKLKAARERKKAATGKCGGHKTYAEARPDVVLLAKQMHDQGMSLRKISAELAARGYVTAGGKPYVASAVQTMLG